MAFKFLLSESDCNALAIKPVSINCYFKYIHLTGVMNLLTVGASAGLLRDNAHIDRWR